MNATLELLEPAYQAMRAGDWAAALRHGQRILAVGHDCATVWHAIGLAHCGGGNLQAARDALATACRLDPATPRWARDAAALQAQAGAWRSVRETLEPALHAHDESALLLYVTAALATGDAPQALAALADRRETLMAGSPALVAAYARLLVAGDAAADAVAVARLALVRAPDDADLHEAAASALEALLRADDAVDHWRRHAELRPDSPAAHLRLALALLDRGHCAASRAAREAAERAGERRPEDHSCALFIMLSDPEVSCQGFLDRARRAFEPATRPPRRRGRSGGARDRLRVGYLSAEFRSTPSFYFTSAFLRAHDRSAVEVVLYNTSPTDDGATVAYRELGEVWRHAAHASPAELRAVILRDQLDVLVDLSGHFPHNRLPILVDRLAPVQASYPHFPATTGCPGIDYLITDRFTSPDGTEDEYAERLWRLPGGYLAFAEPDDAPPLTGPLFPTFTFGVFQRLAKLTPAFFDIVAEVLRRTPDSQLLLHNGDHELDRPDSRTTRWIASEFEARGVGSARLVLRGRLSRREHLALAGAVDVALDTFPYGGQTTTCESLWMGVPVVTLVQHTHVSRVCAGLLTRAGCAEAIARTPGDYVDIAAGLAATRGTLDTRAALRAQFVAAGLTDGGAVARGLEDAYRHWLEEL